MAQMPYVEIHGYKLNDTNHHEEISKVKNVISLGLVGTEFENLNIEVVCSQCECRFGYAKVSKPFLRVCDTDMTRGKKVAGLLDKILDRVRLNMDIQLLELARFYPMG